MIFKTEQFLLDLAPHGIALQSIVEAIQKRKDAKAAELKQLLKKLPMAKPSRYVLDQDWVAIGESGDLSPEQKVQLTAVLSGLKPWRKGPFELFGVPIDSEWNSALKWQRVAQHMAPLTQRKVLDVGSSNGYYLFRMAASTPRVVLGIEPYSAYYHQFLVLEHYLKLPQLYNLPLKLEELPSMPAWFDTIFCMGILYHRRSPLETLAQLKSMLAPGGQLILETLILQGDGEFALSPKHRYAGMRNIYFIPTVACLNNWLTRSGFINIRCVNTAQTSFQEQRKTQWIDSDSLEHFLDPKDTHCTAEGYPAPVRAVLLADVR